MTKFFTKIDNPNEEMSDDEDFFSEEEMANDENEEKQKSLINNNESSEEEWIDKEETEGQLSVDVYQTRDNVVIKSTIAGVRPEDIETSIDNDVITIRGHRKMEETIKDEDYFYQECYWGSFSRSIVLPVEIKPDETEATLKNGVLTIVMPKTKKTKSVAVKVKSE